MRSIEEQMKEIRRRKAIYQSIKDLRRKIIIEASVSGVCTAMMIMVVCFLPRINEVAVQAPIRQYGSMILSVPSVGYVLIALLSFILGVAVTLLCQHWKQRKEKEREI